MHSHSAASSTSSSSNNSNLNDSHLLDEIESITSHLTRAYSNILEAVGSVAEGMVKLSQVSYASIDVNNPRSNKYFQVADNLFESAEVMSSNYLNFPNLRGDNKKELPSEIYPLERTIFYFAREVFRQPILIIRHSEEHDVLDKGIKSYQGIVRRHVSIMQALDFKGDLIRKMAIAYSWWRLMILIQQGKIPQCELREKVLGEKKEEFAQLVTKVNEQFNKLSLQQHASTTVPLSAHSELYGSKRTSSSSSSQMNAEEDCCDLSCIDLAFRPLK